MDHLYKDLHYLWGYQRMITVLQCIISSFSFIQIQPSAFDEKKTARCPD